MSVGGGGVYAGPQLNQPQGGGQQAGDQKQQGEAAGQAYAPNPQSYSRRGSTIDKQQQELAQYKQKLAEGNASKPERRRRKIVCLRAR